jgi:hypothetical protein
MVIETSVDCSEYVPLPAPVVVGCKFLEMANEEVNAPSGIGGDWPSSIQMVVTLPI